VKHNHEETETKLYTPDLASVEARLQALGALLIAPRVYERNVRYDDADGTLTPNHIVLRLRQDTRARLTYKADGRVQDGIITRFEAEVEVSDFDTMALILGRLGYQPQMVYEKYRTTYTLDGAEITLDELPYGNFIEVEGQFSAIQGVIERLGLADAPRFGASYSGLFWRVRQHLGLSFADLTFDNFAGIRVPPEAFAG
jgi:adenylate cyclase class 2